ncbi:MAG: acylphosphatase [Desulfobulbaceae bacterium]|nr:acylphosphatase [Desulfobulbaceae bacterium]
MKGTHVIVQGRVQGVYFRDYTTRQARQYNLTGWVQNLPDGSVEALFFGDSENINAMLLWLKTGSPQSKVTKISTKEIDVDSPPTSFETKY